MPDQIRILLVEDNREHLKLTQYILKRNKFPGELFVVRDGQEAIDFLFHQNAFADEMAYPCPDLVLLDLNTPRMNGRELLRILKDDAVLREIPIVVMSSSDREEDVSFASQMGATLYISKAAGFESLANALSSIHLLVRTRGDGSS